MAPPRTLLAAALVAVLALAVAPAASFMRRPYVAFDENIEAPAGADVGEPLLISRVREASGAAFARDAAKVTSIGPNTSYAGFYEVNKTTENNLFTWYFPAQNGNKDAPLLIWLQGGPGGSSLFGLFSENGPFYLTKELEIMARDTTWNSDYGMLFIDNPVGAGFSYTGTGQGWATNSKVDVARDLFNCLTEFYKTFPDQAKVDLYITGESFAGHYIPAFGAYIHEQNANGAAVPLKGVSIGDGWTDPILQMTATPALMFNLGLADANQVKVLQDYSKRTEDAIHQGDYKKAFDVWDEMLNGDVYPYATYFYNLTASMDYDNFLRTEPPESFGYYSSYVTQPDIRKQIHVGNATFNSGLECEMHLINDVMYSYKTELGLLMNNYKVLIYNGQLDLIVGVPLTETFLPSVQWNGSKQFAAANRTIWKVQDSDVEVAGYVRNVNSFTQVVVRGAGHIAPYDQGRAVKDMVYRFIRDQPF